MTRGADTTSAWVLSGAWPGSGVPVALSVVSQQSIFSDLHWVRGYDGVLTGGGAENTKAVRVPPGACLFSTICGGTGCSAPYFLFS